MISLTKLILLFIFFYSIELHIPLSIIRKPASSYLNFNENYKSDRNILNKVKEACDSSQSVFFCDPYIKAKNEINKEGKIIVKSINDNLTPEVTAVSSFVLKSIYEKSVFLEYKSFMGKQSVSISNDQTVLKWYIDKSF